MNRSNIAGADDLANLQAEIAGLQARLDRVERERDAFRQVASVFGSLANLEETNANLAETVASLVDAERCVVVTLEPGTGTLVARPPGIGWTPDQLGRFRIDLEEPSATGTAWRDGRAYVSNAPQIDPRNLHRFVSEFGERNLLTVLLRVGQRTVAVVRVSNRVGDFTPGDVELIQAIGAPAALALDNAQLYQAVVHERERLRAIFQNASDGILIIDQNRRVVALNPAMERLTGWPAEAAVGFGYDRLQGCRDEAGSPLYHTALPIIRIMTEGRPLPYFETRITTRDGEERDVAGSYSLIPVPGRAGEMYGLAVTRDISPAKEVARLKSQFLSTVSHELRTPLAAIRASIGILGDHLPEDFPEPLRRLVANIDRSSSRLEALVSDLLDLARLQTGRVELQPVAVDARQIVDSAVAVVSALAGEKGQSVRVSVPADPVIAELDRPRIEQVLINLLSNAQKYSPAGTTVGVGVETTDGGVRFGVSDQGPGIPEGEQAAIFERFYRLTNDTTLRTAGSGLGLAIAKAIAEQHGGRLGLDSELGQGSTFWVELPREFSHENTAD